MILNTCIIIFSIELHETVLTTYSCTKIAEINAPNGAVPIYKFSHEGKEIAFYLSAIGATGTSEYCIEANWLTGAEKFIMFGSAGSLNKGQVALRQKEGCIAVDMELAGVQSVCDFYGFDLYDFLVTGDVLSEDKYEIENLNDANHNLEKLVSGFLCIKTKRHVSPHQQSATSVYKSHYLIWCTPNNLTQLFQCNHRDVLILFQRV